MPLSIEKKTDKLLPFGKLLKRDDAIKFKWKPTYHKIETSANELFVAVGDLFSLFYFSLQLTLVLKSVLLGTLNHETIKSSKPK